MIGSWSDRILKQLYWNEHLQTMPRELLERHQLQKIQAAINFAYHNSDLHRKIYDDAGIKPGDIKSWEDFYQKVPFTDKPNYIVDQQDKPFAAQSLASSSAQYYFQTSGTTGHPLREVFSLYDTAMLGEQWAISWWDSGIRPDDKFYFCFDWGIWIGLWSAYWGCRQMGATVYSGGGLKTRDRIKQMLDLGVTAVVGTPTYLLHLGHEAADMGYDLRNSSIKYLTGGGEAGFNIPATRKALEDKWGAICVDFFGIGELGHGAIECGVHPGGVHVCEPFYHAYTIDPETGQRCQDGEVGEYVVTSFAHTMQPFIKYRTHDLVELHKHSDHGCGWTWAYMPGSALGRTDFMVVIRGVNVYPTAVENLLSKVNGTTNYYELHISRQDGMDRLLVKVEADREVPTEQYGNLAGALADLYKDQIGVRIETEVVEPETLPRYELKSKKIIDHRSPEERGRRVTA